VRAFDVVVPDNLADAVRRGGGEQSRFVAGGTLLVDLLRLNVERPRTLIDLNGVLSSRIEWRDDGLMLGAAAKNSDVAYDARVMRELPVLSEALLSGASPQLRNMASVGGNLLQRTRCSFFRDPAVAACNKREPGSGCAARDGYSRMHAILGVSDRCIAAHPSDMCVALLALDAVVLALGPTGKRQIAIDAFHLLPGAHPERESVLEPAEIVTEVWIPQAAAARRSAYVKARDRASFAFALASAGVALELDGQLIKSARVALGGVGTKPWRASHAEHELVGKPLTTETFARAADLAIVDPSTTLHNAFKVELAKRCVVRALERAGGST
jgi:xanthine dehydrogenase YagS FAD-binding subunit